MWMAVTSRREFTRAPILLNKTEKSVDTIPVQEKHQFDIDALDRYMQIHVEDYCGPLAVFQFKGGQSNPTYKLLAKSGQYVLRRKPPGKLLASAHAVDREYRVMTALAGSDVPVAKTYCLCEDESVIGTAFFIMECVAGRVLWNPELPEFDNAQRAALYQDMNRVISALHQVDYMAAGLESFGKPGNYFARQISRWSKQYRASETCRIEEMEQLMAWLPENIPAGEEACIVHGDFRLDNVMLHPEKPEIVAVLDWELSTIGHPLADFAYHCMTWLLPRGIFRGLAGVDLQALSIPSQDRYLDMYCHRSGRDIPREHWNFYMAYNLFRLAGIAQGIVGRVREGTAANQQAAEMESGVAPLAVLACQQIAALR